MKILERQPQKNLGDAVASEHLDKCVRMCLTDIGVTKNQNDMEKRQCKYCCFNLSSIYEK